MPNSQFDRTAKIQSDRKVLVTGAQHPQPATEGGRVAYHFLLIQGDVIARGTGRGHGEVWSGVTEDGEPELQLGPALAIGLAILPRKAPEPGFMTFGWSKQIELVLFA
jgi:hypothetical protein